MILMIVPARSGSKGLPGKNLAEVGGIPLVGRAVWTARRALTQLGEEGKVICSTDGDEIARVAKEWGAEVPFMRPAEFATDGSPTLDVVLHALRFLGMNEGTVVVLQPTSPLTEPKDVVAAVRTHRDNNTPVVAVCDLAHPLEWIWSMNPNGKLEAVHGRGSWPARRQDAPSHVRPNGAVYVADVRYLLHGGGFLDEPLHGVLMPRQRSVDIDAALDLVVARSVITETPPLPVGIGDRKVGPGRPCFIIAEAGVNHDGDVDVALRLVDAAAEAGADAVKFQTFLADRLVTKRTPKAEYQLRTTEAAESQYDMLRRLELGKDALESIIRRCRERNIMFLSTPFDESSADLLEALDVPAFKISSGDLTDLPFLSHVAHKGRPMIVSTGMGTMREVADAVETIRGGGLQELVLLQCVSNYPADPATVNLRAMGTLRDSFNVPVGFSDHTEGIEISVGAVAMGAAVVEKHFTLDRKRPGPDHEASIEPEELAKLVSGIRRVELSIGDGRKVPARSEFGTAAVARKSVVALRTVQAGELLTPENTGVRRPEGGLRPGDIEKVWGRRTKCVIEEGEFVRLEMLE